MGVNFPSESYTVLFIRTTKFQSKSIFSTGLRLLAETKSARNPVDLKLLKILDAGFHTRHPGQYRGRTINLFHQHDLLQCRCFARNCRLDEVHAAGKIPGVENEAEVSRRGLAIGNGCDRLPLEVVDSHLQR